MSKNCKKRPTFLCTKPDPTQRTFKNLEDTCLKSFEKFQNQVKNPNPNNFEPDPLLLQMALESVRG